MKGLTLIEKVQSVLAKLSLDKLRSLTDRVKQLSASTESPTKAPAVAQFAGQPSNFAPPGRSSKSGLRLLGVAMPWSIQGWDWEGPSEELIDSPEWAASISQPAIDISSIIESIFIGDVCVVAGGPDQSFTDYTTNDGRNSPIALLRLPFNSELDLN